MNFFRVFLAMVTFAGLGVLSACGSNDQTRVTKAVTQLANGDLIRQMNAQTAAQEKLAIAARLENSVDHSSDNSAAAFTTSSLSGSSGLPLDPTVVLPLGQTPCLDGREESDVYVDSDTDLRAKGALDHLMACVVKLGERQETIYRVIQHFINFNDTHGSGFSLRSMEDLQSFLAENDRDPMEVFANPQMKVQFSELRIKFDDKDLNELRALIARRNSEAGYFSLQITSVIHHRPKLFARFASHSRIKALLAISEARTLQDDSGLKIAQALKDALTPFGFTFLPDLARYPIALAPNWSAIYALPPAASSDSIDLDLKKDHPFRQLMAHQSELIGPNSFVEETLSIYAGFRNADNPAIPAHSPAAPGAVKVAFMDTGVDFVQYKPLGLFLGDGTGNHMGQIDFADLDHNPYSPYFGGLSHGSGTQGTFLTLMSQLSRDLLDQRKVELASWKVFSLRSLLAGTPYHNLSLTDARVGFVIPTALVNRIDGPPTNPRPDIVSISLAGQVIDRFMKMDKRDVLTRAPWLWVMAAGNEGSNIEVQKNSCFSDVPKEFRKDENLLCVGAIVRTAQEDRIATYSNFGSRVDLYAYETYDDRCPNGTSCSTPAITTAAAILKAQFPALSPSLIKSALVQSAEVKAMPVDGLLRTLPNGSLEPRASRKVRFFDPVTMMPKAIAAAKNIAAVQAAKIRSR